MLGVLNPGNKRASMFGATYDLLEFHVTVIVILHENQRSTSLLGLSRPQFSEAYLTKADTRGPWSLHPSGEPSSKEMVVLPATSTNNHRISNLSNWFWLTDWQIDYSDPRVDPTSGWQYARSFSDEDPAWTPVAPTSGYNWVRRRRWVRVMKRRMDLTKGSHRGENMTIANDLEEEEEESGHSQDDQDYLLKAEKVIQSVKSDMNSDLDTSNTEVLRQDITKYKEAIDILSEAIKSCIADDNEFRIHQASTLVRSYIAHIEKLHTKIGELETSNSITEPPSLTLDLDDVVSTNTNPWSNSLSSATEGRTVHWAASPQQLNSVDLFTAEEQQHTRVWESDTNAKTCRICVRKFGLLLRRHHCRKCGLVVCDKCSPYKVFLNPSDILQDPEGILESVSVLATRQQRMCEKCYFQDNMITSN
ncbi:FYVE zinc finger-domain-containing protein [Gilbertella persicaria]|uniref:FYVE zinc finger-domain-containing protein n=1 Tax=Gilbertella persicaria TaxID=101096 RepID=UPI00221E4327|nr:FYVE zinc finger-domain-containing protein [Gilbertella persicaria]KAI8054158.1 FYVE zinc finger-domain-containing protein [Gilbertella persicaria]